MVERGGRQVGQSRCLEPPLFVIQVYLHKLPVMSSRKSFASVTMSMVSSRMDSFLELREHLPRAQPPGLALSDDRSPDRADLEAGFEALYTRVRFERLLVATRLIFIPLVVDVVNVGKAFQAQDYLDAGGIIAKVLPVPSTHHPPSFPHCPLVRVYVCGCVSA